MYAYCQSSVSNYAAVRWNGPSKCFEAQDQWGSWSKIDIDLLIPSDTIDLMNYVREMQMRDRQLNILRLKYPALDKAMEHAELVKVMCEAEENKPKTPTVL